MSQENIEYKTLLLVEDEVITAMSEAAMLKRHGYNVITAYSGEAAIQHATSGPAIDLVLMDIDLGDGMDGTDAAGIILQKKNLPVVFLSSHTEKDIVEKTEGVSSYGYIVKNSGETVLIASIKMAFRLHQAGLEIERQKEEIEAANEELQGTIEELEATNEELVRSQQEIVERDNALRRSVHMLEESQKIAHLGHWDHDLVNNSIYWSDEMYRIFDVEPQKFTATYEGFLSYVHPDDRDFLNAAYTSSVKSRRPYDIVHRLLLADGMVRYVNAKCETSYDENGKQMRSFGTVLDITERKTVEQQRQEALDALRVSEERFSKIFMKNPVAMTVSRMSDGVIVDINKSFERIYGINRAEGIGKKSFDSDVLVDPSDRDKMIAELAENGMIRGFETRFRNGYGKIYDILLSTDILEINAEKYALSVILDITALKQTERALRETEERLRAIFDTSLSGIILLDTKGKIEYANNRLAQMFGLPIEKLTGSEYTDYVHPSERAAAAGHISKLVQGQINDTHTERRYIRADGSEFWGYISGKRLNENEKGPSPLVGIITDMTELRLAEEKLKESEQRHKLIARLITDYVFRMSVDEDGSVSIVDASENFANITGRNLENMSRMDIWLQTINSDDMQIMKDNLGKLIATGGPVDFECRTFIKDGQSRWVQIFAQGEREAPGQRVTGIVGAVRDITERKNAEEELKGMVIQKETLMRELQHRVKNNLVMITSLFTLESDRASSDETRSVLQKLRDRVSSLENLYSLLNRSGSVDTLRMDQYIDGIVGSILSSYPLHDSGITIEVDCDPVEISVKTAASMGLAVNELITNALKHAFSGRGGGTVRVSLRKLDSSFELSVRDNGSGLSEGFDPAHVSGFGLRLAGMLAKQLGGSFKFRNDDGAVFTLTCPTG